MLWLLVALLMLASVALVGCSGDTDASDAAVTTDGAVASQTVTIGFAGPLTGDNALYGQSMLDAAKIAVDELNASDEAKDKGITFVIKAEDDMGDPKQAVNVANTLAADQSVIALVGHFNSGCSIPASTVYEENNLAMISVSTNPQLTDNGLAVTNRITARDDSQGPAAAELVFNRGITKLVAVDDATAYGQGLADEFMKAYEELGGEVISHDRHQPKEVDFTSLVTKISATEAQAVYYAGAHKEGAGFAKQLRDGGVSIPVIGGEMLNTPEYILLGGSGTEGDIATNLGLPIEEQPKGVEFLEKYRAAYNREPELYDTYSYDSAMIIGQAVLENSDDITRVTIGNAIRNIRYDGVTGMVSFDEKGDNTQQIISAYIVTDGAWVPLKD